MLNYHLGTCALTHHAKSYTLRPLSYSGANSSLSSCVDTVRPVAAPVASTAKVPIEQSISGVAQCKRALRQGCKNFLVMVNTTTASSLGVSLGTVTSVTDNTSPLCATLAIVIDSEHLECCCWNRKRHARVERAWGGSSVTFEALEVACLHHGILLLHTYVSYQQGHWGQPQGLTSMQLEASS